MKDADKDWSKDAVVIKFDQKELLDKSDSDFSKSGLSKAGYLYYPKSCAKEKCAV